MDPRTQDVKWEDDLYREIILDHFSSPRREGTVAEPDISVHGVNPVCGDELTISAKVSGNALSDFRIKTRGCSISQASSSIMAEALQGKKFSDARRLIDLFKGMMLEGQSAEALPADLEDAKALEGVKHYPVRIKCALLAWNSALQGLSEFQSKHSKVETTVTEKTEDDIYGK